MKTQSESRPESYMKLFRLLSDAKDRAEEMELHTLTHFADMALVQVVLDWEKLDPGKLTEEAFERLVREKSAIATDAARRDRGILFNY